MRFVIQIEVDADEFIAVKGYKAKGKRLSNYEVGNSKRAGTQTFSRTCLKKQQRSTSVEIEEEEVTEENTGADAIVQQIGRKETVCHTPYQQKKKRYGKEIISYFFSADGCFRRYFFTGSVRFGFCREYPIRLRWEFPIRFCWN